MNKKMRLSTLALAVVTLASASGATYGMGFGRPVSRAVLGEPLRVSLPLRLEAGEEIAPECLAAEVHFGSEVLAKSLVQVSLTGSTASPTITLRTNAPINEPVVTYQVTAGCQSKISRQFVDLADPPGFQAAAVIQPREPVIVAEPVRSAVVEPQVLKPAAVAAVSASSETPAQKSSAAVKAQVSKQPVAKAVAKSAAATPSTVASPKNENKPVAKAAAPVTKPATTAPISPVAPDGGRLELDPVAAEATAVPSLRMSSALGTSISPDEVPSEEVRQRREAAAAMWHAMNQSPEDIVRDQQAILAKEAALAASQTESVKASEPSKPVAVAQQSVEADELDETQGWLTYLVGAFALGGMALCAVLYTRLRRRQKEEADWWAAQMQEPQEPQEGEQLEHARQDDSPAAPANVPLVPSQPSKAMDATVAPTNESAEPESSKLSWAAIPAVMEPETAPALAPVVASYAAPERPVVAESMREVSVEELIDLEQQAEFFVVLGQDDAAIELLESHVQSVAASPLPYLKLLEIYQRLGQREDYERIQEVFNQRFNAHAPSWDSDLQHGHALADYPRVVERLQNLWQSPTQAMALLEQSLTRTDSEVETFELPAYRELLLLYAVARDLSERAVEERDAVDLLSQDLSVPTTGDLSFDLSEHAGDIQPLMVTRPVKAAPEVQPTFSLDLQLDDLTAELNQAMAAQTKDTAAASAAGPESEHIDLPELTMPHQSK